jgi:hypothetical protein
VVRLTVWGPEFWSFRISGLEMVSQTFASWNLIGKFLRQLDSLRGVA